MMPMDSPCYLSRRAAKARSDRVKFAQPIGLNRRRVEQLLSKTKSDRSAANRIEFFSRQFLGQSYEPNPLIGSASSAEVFSASFEGFDCVTYIETVLALALASNVDDFTEWLRKIRYERGRIEWDRRNHYMTFWIRNNVREGIIGSVSMSAVPTLTRERVLNVISGLVPQSARVKCVPKRAVPRFERYLQTGDLIFFASTRKHLDVFHAGIIVRGEKVSMRHASRSKGAVVEQGLSDFLDANRMTGVIVMRPQQMV
jgi:hypothetical protein